MNRTLPGLEVAQMKRRLAKGSLKALVIHVSGLGMAFLSQLVLTRALGSEGYGVYAFAFAWVTVFARFCTFGFETSLIRFVASYRALELWRLSRGVIRYAERRVILGGMAVLTAGGAILWLSGDRMAVTLRDTLMIGLAVVPVWALLRVRCATVRALGSVIAALAPDRVVREGTIVVLVGLASFGLSWKIEAPQAMAATLIGALIGLIVVSLARSRLKARAFGHEQDVEHATSEWRRAILPLVIMAGAQLLMTRTAVVMTGWMIGTTEAGYVALAANLAILVGFPQTIVNTMFTPTIAMLFKREDQAGLQAITTAATRWICVLSFVVIIPLMVGTEQILILFGRDFVDAAPVLRILLLGQLVNAAAGPVLQIINMSSSERYGARILVVSAMAGLAVHAALIPTMGIIGAALASALSLIGWNIAMAVFVYRHLGLLPSVLGSFPGRIGRASSAASSGQR